ncbi:MAG: hypothetical protein HWN66_10835 [Candidatus Helarchaeota archaeon]|nr:hypothetical protein [Candidatus Helarchaeota archaeon]
MVREKIGFFQRFIASVGKRLLWWRADKMDLYVLALMARETVIKYREILDGDLEKAVTLLKEQFAESAKTFLSDFMDQMRLIMSKDLNDMPFMSEVALYAILGKNYKKFFLRPRYITADDPDNEYGVPHYRTVSTKCLLCSVIQDLNLEEYKDLNYGEIISYALGSLVELIFDYIGLNYRVEVREIHCFLRGDPYSEIHMLLFETEK